MLRTSYACCPRIHHRNLLLCQSRPVPVRSDSARWSVGWKLWGHYRVLWVRQEQSCCITVAGAQYELRPANRAPTGNCGTLRPRQNENIFTPSNRAFQLRSILRWSQLHIVAAIVSRLVKSKDSPCDPMLVRDLRAYLFQAFLRHVNHLKRASRNAAEAFRLTWTYPHTQR